MYNTMQQTMLPVERPLIKNHMTKIDKTLTQGLRQLNWKSHGIDNFLQECMAAVQDANAVLATMKGNLTKVEALLEDWCATSMLQRRAKPMTVEEFNDMFKQQKKQRYQMVAENGKTVHKLLKDTIRKLKVSAGLPDWKAYVDFVNNIVVGGLVAFRLAVGVDDVVVLVDGTEGASQDDSV